MSLAPGFHALWPTPLGVHRFDQAEALNPLLARVLNQTADALERAREGRRASLRAKSYLEAGECSPVLGDGDGFDNGFGNDGAAYAHD